MSNKKKIKELELELLSLFEENTYLRGQIEFYKNSYQIEKSINKMNKLSDEIKYNNKLIESELMDIKLHLGEMDS